jgi:hypothetical protein
LIEGGLHATAEMASELEVNEDALYRVLRALASQGVFEETASRRFKNSQLSHFLRSDVPGSLRHLIIFWGTDFYYRSLGEILYSVETGKPGRAKLLGMSEWEYMRQNPEVARIFDDAMTSHSEVIAPTIAIVVPSANLQRRYNWRAENAPREARMDRFIRHGTIPPGLSPTRKLSI